MLRTTGLQGGQAGLANLADLLNPVADAVLPRLPPPQAGALRAALGLAAADVPVTATLLERARQGCCVNWLIPVWWWRSMMSSGWTLTACGCWSPRWSG